MPTGGIEAGLKEKSDALMKVAGRGCNNSRCKILFLTMLVCDKAIL